MSKYPEIFHQRLEGKDGIHADLILDDEEEPTDNANPEGCNQYKPCGQAGASKEANDLMDDEDGYAEAVMEEMREMTGAMPAGLPLVADGNKLTGVASYPAVIADRSPEELKLSREVWEAVDRFKAMGFKESNRSTDSHVKLEHSNGSKLDVLFGYEGDNITRTVTLAMNEQVFNAFCPTGPGGGLDNSCSPLSGSMGHKEGYESTAAGDVISKASSVGFEEVHDKLVDEMMARQWDPDTEAALSLYTDKNYGGKLNKDARDCNPVPDCTEDPVTFKLIQNETSQPLAEPTQVYRGLYGGYAQKFVDMEVGGEETMKGFASTSLNKEVASDFGKYAKPEDTKVVLSIKAKTGAYVAHVSNFKNELEILQSHGVTYRKLGHEQQGEIYVVHMEEVHAGPTMNRGPKEFTVSPMLNAFCPTGPGGGRDNSCSPGGTSTGDRPQKREGLVESLKREVNAIADRTEFADGPAPGQADIGRYGPMTSAEYDVIEAAMTPDERVALEESLMQAADSAVDSYLENWEPDSVSFGDMMDHAGVDFSEVGGTFSVLAQSIVDPDVQDAVKTAIDEWDRESDHAAGAVSLREHIKSSVDNVPQDYLDAVDEKVNEFEAQLLNARVELEDQQRIEVAEQVRDEYEGSGDRRDALREFYQDNLDRFEGTPEPHKWYEHSRGRSGGYELDFKATNGDSYSIIADRINPVGMKGMDVRFMNNDVADKDAFGITGKGGANDVFMNVMGSIQKLMDVESPDVVTFSAAEPSRRKLYDRIVKTMAKLNPSMSAVYLEEGGARYYAVTPRENKEKVLAYVKQKHEMEPTVLVNEFINSLWRQHEQVQTKTPASQGRQHPSRAIPR